MSRPVMGAMGGTLRSLAMLFRRSVASFVKPLADRKNPTLLRPSISLPQKGVYLLKSCLHCSVPTLDQDVTGIVPPERVRIQVLADHVYLAGLPAMPDLNHLEIGTQEGEGLDLLVQDASPGKARCGREQNLCHSRRQVQQRWILLLCSPS